MEQSQMVLFENFQFHLQDRVLQNYTPLGELQVGQDSLVKVVVSPYDLKSVLYHYHKTVHFLNHPPLIAYYFHDQTKAQKTDSKDDKQEDTTVEHWLKDNLAAYSTLSDTSSSKQ